MSSTTPLTGSLFSTISPTAAMVSSSPSTIFLQRDDRRDQEVDEREHDQDDREMQEHRCGHALLSASSRITSSEPP